MHTATVRPTAGAAILACPAAWLKVWGLESGQAVRLSFGQRFTETILTASAGRRAAVWLPAGALHRLLVPTGIPLNLTRSEGGLRLGPLIGILTSLHITGTAPPPTRLGPQATFFAHLCRVGRRFGAAVFVFGPEHVRWQRGEVMGVVWRGSGWGRAVLPLPDAVYLRTQARSADRRPGLAHCLRRLEEIPGIVLFNRGFFDKWEVHEALSGHPEAQRFLPETRHYTGPHDLTDMLARHPQVFVKPDGGSLGIGIVRIRRLPRGLFEYRRSLRAGDRARVFSSLAAVCRRTQAVARRHHYIVQQGLNLARAGGATFDIRMLVQKDRSGQWSITSGVARLAATGRLATNIFLGGEALGATRILRAALGAAAPGRQQMAETGRLVASALEQQLGRTLGEVGIDFGVDQTGRIWVIEVNSRPARNWPWPPGPAAPRSVRVLVEHMLFTTGFLPGNGKGGSV
ncbi:MAG: YheC/YheD family endospore coat-associated protein [Symbiobacteriia bacterium]